MSADPDKDTAIADNASKQCSVDTSVDFVEKEISRKKSRSVSFPDDNQLVTQYFEPANPWQNVQSTNRAQLVADYLEACRRHNTPPIDTVLQQIRELPENSMGGGTRASRLILSDCSLSGSAPVDALESILSKVQFRRIELDHAEIDDEGAEAIFDMIEYYESATVVCISGPRQFGIRGWQAASRMIKKSCELIELEVRWMGLAAMHAPVLARALRSPACRLRALALPRADLAGDPLLCLVIALKSNTSIRELRLPDNNLQSSDAQQIAALLRYNTTIQLLDLSNNKIQDSGVGYLADALVDQAAHTPPSATNSPMSPLHFPMGTYDARGLAFLVLWNNELTRNCAPHLSKALRSCHSLCVLNVGRNALGCESVRAVSGGALVSLGLQAAKLTADAGLHLADMLHTNHTLQRLDLRENRLGVPGLQALLAAVKDNTTITQIDLDDPPESTTLSEESEAATISRLTREIRTLCRRNEPPSLDAPDHRVHRKISLTCHPTCLLKSGCAAGTPALSSAGSVSSSRARLRSPLPSPAPSPAGSPVPHAHSRFSVTRVTPERESSTDSNSSTPSTPTRPSPCSTPSRFKVVQVAEPPQIQVHPAKRSSRFSVTRNYDAIYNPSPSSSPSPSPTPSISPTLASDSVTTLVGRTSEDPVDKKVSSDCVTTLIGHSSSDASVDKTVSNDRVTSLVGHSSADKIVPSDKNRVTTLLGRSCSDVRVDNIVSSGQNVDKKEITTIFPDTTDSVTTLVGPRTSDVSLDNDDKMQDSTDQSMEKHIASGKSGSVHESTTLVEHGSHKGSSDDKRHIITIFPVTTDFGTTLVGQRSSSDVFVDNTGDSVVKQHITTMPLSTTSSSDVPVGYLRSSVLVANISSIVDKIPNDQDVSSRLSSSDGNIDKKLITTVAQSLINRDVPIDTTAISSDEFKVDNIPISSNNKIDPYVDIIDKTNNPTTSAVKLVSDTNLNRIIQPNLVPNSRFSISPSSVNLETPEFKEDAPTDIINLKDLDILEKSGSNLIESVPEIVNPVNLIEPEIKLVNPVPSVIGPLDNVESSSVGKTLDKLENILPDTPSRQMNTNKSLSAIMETEEHQKQHNSDILSKNTENPILTEDNAKSFTKEDNVKPDNFVSNVENDNVPKIDSCVNDNTVRTDSPVKVTEDVEVDTNENPQGIELNKDIIKNISDLNKSTNKTYSEVLKTDPKLKDKIENISFETEISEDTIRTETNLSQNSVTVSDTDVIDVNVKVTVKTESVKEPSDTKTKGNQDIKEITDIKLDDNSIKREKKAMKQIEAITEDLGNLIKEMKDLSFKNKKIKSDTIDLMNTVPGNFKDVVLKKNKSESSLDSPDLEVSRLMNKKLEGSPFCDSSSSLEISGSSMESLNALESQKPIIRETKVELDRRKVDFCQESSVESTSETNPVNMNFLNMSMSSNESVSPIIFGRTKKIHDSLSSLEASVSSIDSGKQEKVMVTSADSGIEYSLQNPNENKDDNSSNEGTLTHNSSLRETVKKTDLHETLTSSPKRTSSLLDVPALKNKGLDRMRKISWVAPSSSFHIPKVETEKEKPSHLEKLLSLFQHPASLFSRSSQDEEKKSASNTPPRKDSTLTSSFWSWGSAIDKDKDDDSSEATDTTLSERVQVSFVDESFSKKLDSKTPSTDTDNTLSEFQSFSNQASTEIDTTVTVTTDENLVQKSLDLSLDNKSDNTDLTKPNDLNKNYETDSNKNDDPVEKTDSNKLEKDEVKEDVRVDLVRPRTFAAVLKSSGSENSLDKQPSPDSGQLVDKLPSKIIRGIKENISPENTLTSSMTNTQTLAMELTERQVKTQAIVNTVWEVTAPALEKNDPKVEEKTHELAPIATIEETIDESADNTIELKFIDDIKVDSKEVESIEKEIPIQSVIKRLENVDLGKEALSYLIYEGQDFEPEQEQNVPPKIEKGSLAQELKEAEIKEMLDLSPELVIDEAVEVPEVLTAKEIIGLKSSPAIPERAKLKKSNSLEDLSQRLAVKTDFVEEKSPRTKTIAFKVPETSPRNIPERRSKLRTRSGSSPKSLPESLNKPCSFSKMEHSKKKKKVSSLGKMARDSLLALNMSEEEIAEFRRSYKLTSVESLRSLESVSEDANSQSGTSLDSRCRACLRTSQESLMSLDSITEDCKCGEDCEKPSRSNR